jgi:hypothetical protein
MSKKIEDLEKRLNIQREANVFMVGVINRLLDEPLAKTATRFKTALAVNKNKNFTDEQKKELMYLSFGISKK